MKKPIAQEFESALWALVLFGMGVGAFIGVCLYHVIRAGWSP